MRRSKKAVLPLNYLVKDKDGELKPIARKIRRPITDPNWNSKQAGTRVRKSKKQRLRERAVFMEQIKAKEVKS